MRHVLKVKGVQILFLFLLFVKVFSDNSCNLNIQRDDGVCTVVVLLLTIHTLLPVDSK